MNQTERHFWECEEPPNGIYPTLNDYTLALEALRRQHVEAEAIAAIPKVAQGPARDVRKYQVGSMSICSLQAGDSFASVERQPRRRAGVTSICLPNSIACYSGYGASMQTGVFQGDDDLISNEEAWPAVSSRLVIR